MVENVDAGRPRTFPALTGMRFFAALAVLMFHYGASFSERLHVSAFASRLLHNGYLGVSLFFVLSGFILTFTYRDRLVNARFLGDFAVAGLARIYPVYLAALLLGLPVLLVPLTPGSAVKVLLMLQAWTPPSSPQGSGCLGRCWRSFRSFWRSTRRWATARTIRPTFHARLGLLRLPSAEPDGTRGTPRLAGC